MSKNTRKYTVTLFVDTIDFVRSVSALKKHVPMGNSVVSDTTCAVEWEFATKRGATKREKELKQYLRSKNWNARSQYHVHSTSYLD